MHILLGTMKNFVSVVVLCGRCVPFFTTAQGTQRTKRLHEEHNEKACKKAVQ